MENLGEKENHLKNYQMVNFLNMNRLIGFLEY